MKLEKFIIEGVDKKGIVCSGGAVETKGGLVIVKGGCGSKGCHLFKTDLSNDDGYCTDCKKVWYK